MLKPRGVAPGSSHGPILRLPGRLHLGLRGSEQVLRQSRADPWSPGPR